MWGVRFLLFQQLVLPYLLEWLDYALDLNLDASKMNLLFYTVNFAVLVGIFWCFLQVNLQHALQNIGTVLVPAIIGFLVRISTFLLLPHTQTGKFLGQVQPFERGANCCLTILSSREWKVITLTLPPSLRQSNISPTASPKPSSSPFTYIRIA